MYSYQLKKLPKNTFEITLIIPKADIEKEKNTAFEKLHKNLAVAGFRKGKVPKKIAEQHIKKEDIYEEMVKFLLPKIYEEIIKKENLQPVIAPKIELIKAKEGEDWEIKISLAGRPLIHLGDYKSSIKKFKADQKKDEIWVPGKDPVKKDENSEEKKQKTLESILNILLNETKIEISDLIMEEELERKLTQLLDDIRKIGLTVESYLKSKNLTIDELKARFRKEIEEIYKLEFSLAEIADKENIRVEKEDIDKLLANITDKKEREIAEQNSYYYAVILRKQKTLDFLLNL